MTDRIGKTEMANMFAQAAACLRSEHQRLTELDSIGGDGDHGTTMLRAADQMENRKDAVADEHLSSFLKAVGWRVLDVDGGASSGLFGTFFAGMGEVELPQDSMDCREFARALNAGLDAVCRQSKARPGDKTMMDALVPAVDAVTAAAGVGKSIEEALDDGSAAATLGAESTKDMVARYGRARSLGERTRGHSDAGATSVALIFKGFRNGLAGGKAGNGRS